jgi:hypothetical protein
LNDEYTKRDKEDNQVESTLVSVSPADNLNNEYTKKDKEGNQVGISR